MRDGELVGTRPQRRVAIVTGAGRGLGRAYALALAQAGMAVVINDVGAAVSGSGMSTAPAEQVCEEIRGAGGQAVASHHDVADWQQARDLVTLAIDHFGALDVLVNNAGILRDRTIAKLTEDEWDAAVRVHLKGQAAPTRHAVEYWRRRAKGNGCAVDASVIFTSSVAGFFGNVGQCNYSAAKLGVVAFARVVGLEASRFGVRANVISPSARTRFTVGNSDEELVLAGQVIGEPEQVAPLVVWLALASCPAAGQIYQVLGDSIYVLRLPEVHAAITSSGQRWTIDLVDQLLRHNVAPVPTYEDFFAGIRPDRWSA